MALLRNLLYPRTDAFPCTETRTEVVCQVQIIEPRTDWLSTYGIQERPRIFQQLVRALLGEREPLQHSFLSLGFLIKEVEFHLFPWVEI